MRSFTTFFLWALAASILCQGFFAKDQSGYICLIEDPIQNQCGSICLTELSPRLSEVVKAQNEGNTNIREFDKEIKSKLQTLEVKIGEVQAKLPQVHAELEEQLQGVENKLEGRLQGVENKLEGLLQGLERQLQEGQTKLEAKLGERLKDKLKTNFGRVLTKLQAVLKDINVAKMEIPDRISDNIPSGFELIGDRYFRSVSERVDWDTAERKCREMGGYLASFRNEEEFNAIKAKLNDWPAYWLGINDRDNEGHFVSVASHNPAPFLKWKEGEPSDRNHEWNCVYLFNGRMEDGSCYGDAPFICQADNET
ncbi:mannose-binding protein-like [Drosophila kikkawai]|uniref:Mannose-binding protein-like n=1 Tax=Drosophila kikkawai TaxID=30033 RepID=A0ABM3C678_DROKI|nr:C-type lectin domain family 3 member A homolog [Drosophila kikkawai]